MVNKNLLLRRKVDFVNPKTEKSYPPSLQLEPIHQTIKLSFDINNKKAIGSVSTKIKANTINSSEISFDVVDLEIIKVKGIDNWNYNGKKIKLSWNTPLKKGEEREFLIEYKIDHPTSGLYFSFPDKNYPKRAIYACTDNESQRARHWLPCIDHPSVRCSIDFFLTSEKEHIILANGKLIDEKINEDNSKTSHWKQEFPCPAYLIQIAVGEFIEYKDIEADGGKGPIPISYFTTKEYTPEHLKISFDSTPKMIKWLYSKLKVSLEWDKYYQIITPYFWGAMENISLVSWGEFAALNEIIAKERKWVVDWINLHEMAHSWFGDMIVIREFAHGWLKESWATYCEKAYFEDIYGENEFLYGLYLDAVDYMEESDDKYSRPIVTNKYEDSWTMYDDHLYPGGSWRIHMLRCIVGDEVFWEATSDYLKTFKGKVVETIDFQRKLEEYSGLSLEKFFEQWLYSPGYPKLKAEYDYDEKTKLCELKLEQTQKNETKKIGLFNFKVEVKWEMENEQYETSIFELSKENHTFYFKCDKNPKQILIDPDYKTLFSLDFDPGIDLLNRQLETGNLICKIRAAKELAKAGKRKNVDSIIKAYKKEEFWGTKVEYVKALKKSQTYQSVEGIISILETEKDPMVLQKIIPTLSGMNYDIVFETIDKFLNRNEKLYLAEAEALKVIGSFRNEKALNFLLNYKIEDDYQDIIESGLYIAIGKTRSKQATKFLLEKIDFGIVSERARRGLFQGLIDSIYWTDKPNKKRIFEKMTSVFQQEEFEFSIVQILSYFEDLGDNIAIPLLESIKSRFSHQTLTDCNRTIDIIKEKQSSENQNKELRMELGDLRSDIRKLKTLIGEMEVKIEKDK
ncbi:MAG: hypothetical protein GY870_01085 [archaeon]|nr:hypothetical protein [archaeon]